MDDLIELFKVYDQQFDLLLHSAFSHNIGLIYQSVVEDGPQV